MYEMNALGVQSPVATYYVPSVVCVKGVGDTAKI